MPNEENIRLWVDALRSGDYTQAKGHLRIVDLDGSRSYCCLGVACELAIADGVSISVTQHPIGGNRQITFFDGRTGELPFAAQEWLGVDSGDPTVSFASQVTAVMANDSYGWDFNQIADALEQSYLWGKTDGAQQDQPA